MSNGYAICNFTECEKAKMCKRYKSKNEEVEEYHFQAICFKNNEFDQLIKKEAEIVPVVEKVKDEVKDDTGNDIKKEEDKDDKKEDTDTNKLLIKYKRRIHY